MTSYWKKGAALCLALVLLTLSALADVTYSPLQKGDKGPKVAALRQRLYDLGYMKTFKKTDTAYDRATEQAVREFENDAGLSETGAASEAMQALLYSAKAKVKAGMETAAEYDLTPDTVPQKDVALPERDGEGYLMPGAAPFVHADREDGRWIYLSDSLQIDISRCANKKAGLEWFEAAIRTRGTEKPYTILSRREGRGFESPKALAKQHGSVLAISDDFFGYRVQKEKFQGVIIRGGKKLAQKTRVENRLNLQPLEVMAMLADGSLRTFTSDSHTAKEFLGMGVTDTWAFGPILVQGGVIPRYFYSKDYRSYREPRCCFGMAEDGSYRALLVTGRRTNSKGAYSKWLAEKMLDMGCVEAINLDGGNTVAMVFMGDIINKPANAQKKSVRDVSGLIAFGQGAEHP